MNAAGRRVDLFAIEDEAARLWRIYEEDPEKIEGVGMLTIPVPVDVVCTLIRKYMAPMSVEVRAAGERMAKHIAQLHQLAFDLRAQAVLVAGGQHMLSLSQPAQEMMRKADMAAMQATDFSRILNAIPEPSESE